ncbi:MAG: hypothetical protein KDA48_08150 [Amphiplicatus sp.]|nr:hypothetical protein [Amphiplicatus sp.]
MFRKLYGSVVITQEAGKIFSAEVACACPFRRCLETETEHDAAKRRNGGDVIRMGQGFENTARALRPVREFQEPFQNRKTIGVNGQRRRFFIAERKTQLFLQAANGVVRCWRVLPSVYCGGRSLSVGRFRHDAA